MSEDALDVKEGLDAPVESSPTENSQEDVAAPAAEGSSPSESDESSAQKRIRQLTYQKHEAERRAQEHEARIRELERGKPSQVQPPNADTIRPPHPDDYDTDEAYRSAAESYNRASVQKYLAEERAQEEARVAQEQRAQLLQTYQQKVAAYAAESEGFVEDVEAAKSVLSFSEPVAEMLASSEKPGEVTHYLAKNPEHALKLARMSVAQAAREIARIEIAVDAAKPKPSNAPPPMSEVGDGTSGDPGELSSNLSTEEWMKRRRAQLR